MVNRSEQSCISDWTDPRRNRWNSHHRDPHVRYLLVQYIQRDSRWVASIIAAQWQVRYTICWWYWPSFRVPVLFNIVELFMTWYILQHCKFVACRCTVMTARIMVLICCWRISRIYSPQEQQLLDKRYVQHSANQKHFWCRFCWPREVSERAHFFIQLQERVNLSG